MNKKEIDVVPNISIQNYERHVSRISEMDAVKPGMYTSVKNLDP